MIVKAKAKYMRISPRKVNEVVRTVRGGSVQAAIDKLSYTKKRAGPIINKVIKSAISNAANKGLDISNLNNIRIARLVANPGPTLVRYRAAPFGMANMIKKRTSHIEVEIECEVSQVKSRGGKFPHS